MADRSKSQVTGKAVAPLPLAVTAPEDVVPSSTVVAAMETNAKQQLQSPRASPVAGLRSPVTVDQKPILMPKPMSI
jgi:hypothetical protein